VFVRSFPTISRSVYSDTSFSCFLKDRTYALSAVMLRVLVVGYFGIDLGFFADRFKAAQGRFSSFES
jgi:hypothetical protein